jgi:flagellar assembly protein FliH
MVSKLIRATDLAENCRTWQAPEVSGVPMRGTGGGLNLQDLRMARQNAVSEGFEEGRQAGLEAGTRECAVRVTALDRILDSLARPMTGLDQRFYEEAFELVKAVARQLVRREMKLDPTHIVGVIREGLAALPMSATDILVRLHPEDAAVVRECLATEPGGGAAERSWRVEIDPLLDRGGCLIVTPNSQVDGRLETRLGRAISTMFEDERGEDHEASGPDAGR